MITYPCGCTNIIHEETGALACIHKCDFHTKERANIPDGSEYYSSLGVWSEPEKYIDELKDALGSRLDYLLGGRVLEIGCGVSPYVKWLKSLGYEYVGLDKRRFATDWMTRVYEVRTINKTLDEACILPESCDLLMMMHVLEHMDGAPEMLVKAVSALRVLGYAIVLVPDDSDPVNPDHEWFFDVESLGICMAKAGLTNIRVEKRKVVERENFLYAIGEKR